MSTIHVQKEGQEWGPFTTEELEGKVVEGVFSPEDLYWTEGMEDWRPLAEILAPSAEPPAGDDSSFAGGETLYATADLQLTPTHLTVHGEEFPIESVAKATVQTETIRRTKPIVGSVLVGVAILCIAFLEIERPHWKAWALWGAILLALGVWWLRLFTAAIRPATTLLIVDLRNGDERLVPMEAAEARAAAMAIDQTVIAFTEASGSSR